MISKTLQLSNNRTAHYFEQGEGEPLVHSRCGYAGRGMVSTN